MTLLMYRFSNPKVRLSSPLCECRHPAGAADGPRQDRHLAKPQVAVQRTLPSEALHRLAWKTLGVCIPPKLTPKEKVIQNSSWD